MSANPTHLAAGPALGYVYQLQVALLQLLPQALQHDDAAIRLEVLDDVSLEYPRGKAPEVIQVHHSSGDRPLTDRSAKVWKTLGIWAGEWETLDAEEQRQMTLLSTQAAQQDSGISMLTNVDRNPVRAAELLEQIASDPEAAQETADDRAAFLRLEKSSRRTMLDRITVLDGATPAVEMHKRLVEALMPTNDARYIPSMAEMIEGWWWSRVPSALQSGKAILAEELRVQIDEVRRVHSTTALPVLDLGEFGEEDLPKVDTQTSTFLQCLAAIEATKQRRRQAVDDYRLTFAHRSRWARRGLLGVKEVERYEKSLLDHWLIVCDKMLRGLDDDANGEVKASAGHDLWDGMEESVYQPLRPETTDPFIQRGSLHQLADEQRLAWHPDAARPIFREGEEDDAA